MSRKLNNLTHGQAQVLQTAIIRHRTEYESREEGRDEYVLAHLRDLEAMLRRSMSIYIATPAPIDLQEVTSAYRGKNGHCCCGCSGKHYYPTDEARRARAAKERGYPVGDEECDDATIQRIVAKINRHIEEAEWLGSCVSLTLGKTLYIAYIRGEKGTSLVTNDGRFYPVVDAPTPHRDSLSETPAPTEAQAVTEVK